MRPTHIKICGLRSTEAATAASDAGADYLGFNFIEGVHRQLSPIDAFKIIENYRIAHKSAGGSNDPKLVGLFRNQKTEFVNETAQLVGLDYVHLCGDEDEADVAHINLPIFRQIRVRPGTTPAELDALVAPHLSADRVVVLDSFSAATHGGSGLTFDWSVSEGVADRDNVLLAGGLNPENVRAAIAQLSPWGVDVSSGVETDGVKDPDRIRAFIEAVRNA